MAQNSKIEWTDHTFNAWWGCIEVSPACDHCYARTWAQRLGFDVWGADAPRRYFGDAHWNEPLRWDRAAAKGGARHRVFCSSMADVFERHPNVDENRNLEAQRRRLWSLIEATPNLDWLLLTKRPQNIISMVPPQWAANGFPRNVWQGFTGERQREFDIRWRDVQVAAARALVIFVSYEPAIGSLVLPNDFLSRGRTAWCIAGGESGRAARPSQPDWFLNLRDQCVTAGVPFHFKQWGEWAPEWLHVSGPSAHRWNAAEPGVLRVGKTVAGRNLEGRTWDQLPLD